MCSSCASPRIYLAENIHQRNPLNSGCFPRWLTISWHSLTKRPSTINRGVLQGVDFKSTIIYNRLPFLLLNILLHQLVCNISRANGQVSSRPEMPTPKLFLQVGKL